MSLKHKLALLFTPSATSLLFGIPVSLIIIATSCVLFAQNSGRFGNFNLSEYVSVTGITSTSSLTRSFFSSIRFNTLFSILFWVLIGFITYNVVYVFRSSVDESVSFIQRFHYVHAQPAYMRRQLVIRVILLCFALILWIMFALLFSWLILPAVLGMVSRSIVLGGSPAYVALGFIITLLMTHLAAVLLRFTLLKVRVSGADNA